MPRLARELLLRMQIIPYRISPWLVEQLLIWPMMLWWDDQLLPSRRVIRHPPANKTEDVIEKIIGVFKIPEYLTHYNARFIV